MNELTETPAVCCTLVAASLAAQQPGHGLAHITRC